VWSNVYSVSSGYVPMGMAAPRSPIARSSAGTG